MLKRPTWTLPRKVGQLVDGKDAAVGPGQQAEVHGELVGQQVPSARRLDRIHVADQVGDGHVRRGELLHEALVSPEPRQRRRIAALAEQLARVLGDRRERVVIDLAAGDDRDALVEQTGELAKDAALGLAPEAEQDEMMPRQQCVHDLRKDRVFIADDAGKQRFRRAEPLEQVAANLFPHGAAPQRRLGPAAVLQFTKGAWLYHVFAVGKSLIDSVLRSCRRESNEGKTGRNGVCLQGLSPCTKLAADVLSPHDGRAILRLRRWKFTATCPLMERR